MTRAGNLKRDLRQSTPEDVVDVDYVVVCSTCYHQPDVVKYNVPNKLLFWECPNGHRGFIEDFEL